MRNKSHNEDFDLVATSKWWNVVYHFKTISLFICVNNVSKNRFSILALLNLYFYKIDLKSFIKRAAVSEYEWAQKTIPR